MSKYFKREQEEEIILSGAVDQNKFWEKSIKIVGIS
jgi:hypothetical protein